MVEMAIFNVQRAITPKVCNPELLCSACPLILLNICVKFHEYILNGFEVTERTRVCGKLPFFNVQRAVTQNGKSLCINLVYGVSLND